MDAEKIRGSPLLVLSDVVAFLSFQVDPILRLDRVRLLHMYLVLLEQ